MFEKLLSKRPLEKFPKSPTPHTPQKKRKEKKKTVSKREAKADTKIQLSEIIAFEVNFVTGPDPPERGIESGIERGIERDSKRN